MGFHFSLWLIEDFGRVGDPDDYDRGPLAWQQLLARSLSSSGPSRRLEKSTADSLLAVVESRGENPDKDWGA
jgi:hypothetical protein